LILLVLLVERHWRAGLLIRCQRSALSVGWRKPQAGGQGHRRWRGVDASRREIPRPPSVL